MRIIQSSSFPGQPTGIAKVLAGLAEIGMNSTQPKDLPKLLPPDKTEAALAIIADVRAYFQGNVPCVCGFIIFVIHICVGIAVAYKRFANNIPLTIDLERVRGLERGVHSALYSEWSRCHQPLSKISGEFPAVAQIGDSASKEPLYFGV